MARREFKAVAVLIVLVVLSLTIQRITAARRYSKVCSPGRCHLDVKGNQKPDDLDIEDDPGDDAAGDDDYDFYRKHGDIPSPGVGH